MNTAIISIINILVTTLSVDRTSNLKFRFFLPNKYSQNRQLFRKLIANLGSRKIYSCIYLAQRWLHNRSFLAQISFLFQGSLSIFGISNQQSIFPKLLKVCLKTIKFPLIFADKSPRLRSNRQHTFGH